MDVGSNSILNICTNSVTAHTHGFHRYPAKFIPTIPKWAIAKYLGTTRGGLVLDPFSGSGTTLVEGLLAGHNTIGIDVDPLSAFIAKVKTTPVDIPKLEVITQWLVPQLEQPTRAGIFRPECTTMGHWFTADANLKLSLIRTLIDEIPEQFGQSRATKDIRDLLLICLSSIVRRVSNADNESQKTYVSHTNLKEPEEAIHLFLEQLRVFRERIVEFSTFVGPSLETQILCTSSCEGLQSELSGASIDLVVTSPPYIKAIDYIYNQMVELFWIGDLFGMQTQSRQNARKGLYIGNKHLSKRDYAEYTPWSTTTGIEKLDEKLRTVYEEDAKNGRRHAYVVFKYYTDMEKHFAELAKCLNRSTHYVMVVGDCSVSGVPFETSEFMVDIATRTGFRITHKWAYQIKNRSMRFDRKGRGGIIAVDWVLDFVKD